MAEDSATNDLWPTVSDAPARRGAGGPSTAASPGTIDARVLAHRGDTDDPDDLDAGVPAIAPVVAPVLAPAVAPHARSRPATLDPGARPASGNAAKLPEMRVSSAKRYDEGPMLGRGGFGEVRVWRDKRIARDVAVKVLRDEVRMRPDRRARFLLEARLQGQLEHPSIVPVYDLGEANGELFFAMKQVRGVTLRAALDAVRAGDPAATPRFSRRKLLTAFSSVCLAVDFAHQRGVIHRDLKPENVMLGDFGEVYVLDWGIAKVIGGPDLAGAGARPASTEPHAELPQLDVPRDAAMTRPGSVLGTPGYMAPEQQRGHADERSDVYALGAVLADILDATRPEIPYELDAIVAAAGARDPARRYPSARALHDAVERYLDGDRDLEVRRTQADALARSAEYALSRALDGGSTEDRARAGGEVGRALGLDPSNQRALRTLMRLLTVPPTTLPPEAEAEMKRRFEQRAANNMGIIGAPATLLLLGVVPFMLWMGVRDWAALGAYIGLVSGAAILRRVCSWSTRHTTLAWSMSLVLTSVALLLLQLSMGLLGVLPAALAIATVAFRINTDRWTRGLLVFGSVIAVLALPVVLEAIGLFPPLYRFSNGSIEIAPHLHAFSPTATRVYIIAGCAGTVGAGILYGRAYVSEILRAERQLTLHAWQLAQIVPAERAPTPASDITPGWRATRAERLR